MMANDFFRLVLTKYRNRSVIKPFLLLMLQVLLIPFITFRDIHCTCMLRTRCGGRANGRMQKAAFINENQEQNL